MSTKAIIQTPCLTLEVEGNSQKELFKLISEAQEVFAEPCCGRCKSDYQFKVRIVDGNDYHELACLNPKCGARLTFGQSKQRPGMLFPVRKLTGEGKPSRAEGRYDSEHLGWTKWRGQAVDEEPAQAGPRSYQPAPAGEDIHF